MVLVLALVVAAALTYANSLGSPKVLDDVVSIDENARIQTLLAPTVLWPERESPIAGRPLVNLTLAINYAIDGTRVTGYRVVNLVFHALCGVMVFVVVRRMLRLPVFRDRWGSHAQNVAWAAALLWLLHPLNSEVVNYITQRTEAMMSLCYLATFYASLRAVDGAPRWTLVAIATCLVGALCKESMATLPVMVVLFDRIFIYKTWGEAWRARRGLYGGLAASWLVIGGIVATGPRIHSTGFDDGVSAWTYLLNQTQMITRYLRLAVWPDSLVVYYGLPQPFTLADVWPYAVLVVGLALLTAIALYARPWLGFAGAWFFVTLAPSSSIVPIVTEVGAERRMYLPLLAILVPLCMAASRARVAGRALVAVVALVAVAYGTTTFARNREYMNGVTLAERTLARWPTAVAHHMVGEELLLEGRSAEALPHLRQATADAPRAHYTLGMLLLGQGQIDEAITELQSFITRSPLLIEVPEAHFSIARAQAVRQRWAEAEAQARQAIAKAPRHLGARRLLADILLNSGNAPAAANAYATYLQLQPDDVDAWTNLGIMLASAGQTQQAVGAFRRVVELRPDDGQAHRNLATALLDAGAFQDAAREARRAMELRPADPVAAELLAQAQTKLGQQ